MSGTSDTTVPWDGTMNTAYGWGGAPHILEVMEFWSDLNACVQDEVFNFPDIDTSDYSTVSLTKKKGGVITMKFGFIVSMAEDTIGLEPLGIMILMQVMKSGNFSKNI